MQSFIGHLLVMAMSSRLVSSRRLQGPLRRLSSLSHVAPRRHGRSAFLPVATAFSNSAAPSRRTVSRATPPLHTAAASGTDIEDKLADKRPVPIILLAGFLGSGKTSTLKHLLENNSNVKIGTIVNDVASVNIDAKLIANSSSRGDLVESGAQGVIELQNGCACCSIADELFSSIIELTQNGRRELDAIVIELSGVADPQAVVSNWKEETSRGHPATRIACLDKTVTLVDACTFGTDWMSWDVVADRDEWMQGESPTAVERKVPELLAEQVEAADLLLVNKIDIAGGEQSKVAKVVARGLNEKASVVETEYGRVDVNELLGNLLDQELEETDSRNTGNSHEHSHEHSGHDHEHSHSEHSEHEASSHSHDHGDHGDHDDESECNDPSHSHSHSHEHSSECSDPGCTDTSHSHSHDHGALAENHLGITSFVYKTAVPFNTSRLMVLLNSWPIPIKDNLDFASGESFVDEGAKDNVFRGVLRSKGFAWLSPANWGSREGCDNWRHETAMYWSHAGKHFGIETAGKWWAGLDKDQIRPYFANNMKEYERIMEEDWISDEWGDRRQELVFIGINLDEDAIRKELDHCLCTEEELAVYRKNVKRYIVREEAAVTMLRRELN